MILFIGIKRKCERRSTTTAFIDNTQQQQNENPLPTNNDYFSLVSDDELEDLEDGNDEVYIFGQDGAKISEREAAALEREKDMKRLKELAASLPTPPKKEAAKGSESLPTGTKGSESLPTSSSPKPGTSRQ